MSLDEKKIKREKAKMVNQRRRKVQKGGGHGSAVEILHQSYNR